MKNLLQKISPLQKMLSLRVALFVAKQFRLQKMLSLRVALFAMKQSRHFSTQLLKLAMLSIFSLSTSITYAASPSEELKSLLNAVNTMQASFTQTIYDNRNKPVEISHGKMSMERPGKFRWEVTKPIPQLIIANQHKLWIYDPDLEQVTIRKFEKATSDTPALLLSHVDDGLDRIYNVKTAPDQQLQWFVLTPKKADSMFEKIKLGFASKQIQQMQLIDHLGHTTTIKFDKTETNKALAASLFTFKPTKNIDVIDETKR